MKKNILSLIIVAYTLVVSAQTTVSVGANYANQVYYSLKNGIVGSHTANAWHLAFGVSSFGSTIMTNNQQGMIVKKYAGSISDWADLDTTGYSTWSKLHNSDTSWTGALSSGAVDFDLGWGTYSMITHQIIGNSIFIIQLSDGSFKKLMVESLISGTYTFKYANLDGSDEISDTITKTNYAGKNFAYYNIVNSEELNLEPNNNSWDLLFTKYITQLPGSGSYGVTGVITNVGVKTAKVSEIDTASVSINDTSSFSEKINTIGYKWKTYSAGTYTIEDSLTFFVKSVSGEMYQINFTNFGGSATGNFKFKASLVEKPSGLFSSSNSVLFSVFPSVLTNGSAVTIDPKTGETPHSITIHSTTGELVVEQSFEKKIILNLPQSGMYFLSVVFDNAIATQRIIIE